MSIAPMEAAYCIVCYLVKLASKVMTIQTCSWDIVQPGSVPSMSAGSA